MPPVQPSVELVTSREIEHFLPVLREVELGDRFLLSMLHWCGIGQRITPLAYWQVYLIRHSGEIIGVTGLYQQPETEQRIYWLGWFGIRPAWRRQGFGSAAIREVLTKVRDRGGRELWVYTGEGDEHAVKFYLSIGFRLLGPAEQRAPGLTMAGSDQVLRLELP